MADFFLEEIRATFSEPNAHGRAGCGSLGSLEGTNHNAMERERLMEHIRILRLSQVTCATTHKSWTHKKETPSMETSKIDALEISDVFVRVALVHCSMFNFCDGCHKNLITRRILLPVKTHEILFAFTGDITSCHRFLCMVGQTMKTIALILFHIVLSRQDFKKHRRG